MEFIKLMNELEKKHITQINDYDYEIRFNQYKKITVKEQTSKVIKDTFFMLGKNQTVIDYFSRNLKEGMTFVEAIKCAMADQLDIFAKILNKFLGCEKSFDEHLENYTFRELEILFICLLKINGGFFLIPQLLKTVGKVQANYKNSITNLLENVMEKGKVEK